MTVPNPQEDAEALVERWWDHATTYMSDAHWRRAAATLHESDPRVLLLGPGGKSDLFAITLALERFLERVGFSVSRMDEELDVESHRSRAREFARIAAVPVTVGSSVEVFDLLVEDRRTNAANPLRHRIKILLPSNYMSGYFAQVLDADFDVRITLCDPLGPTIDQVPPSVGRLILKRLAEELNSTRGQWRGRDLTERAPEPSNLQAREVTEYPPELDSPATINVHGEAYFNSTHASGEGSTIAGHDAAAGGGTLASGEADVAMADRGSQAATGSAEASGGASERKEGSPKAAIFFGLLLLASIIALVVGLEAAVVGVGVGAIGGAVAVFRLYRGN